MKHSPPATNWFNSLVHFVGDVCGSWSSSVYVNKWGGKVVRIGIPKPEISLFLMFCSLKFFTCAS